jgi:hypothetical protein
MLLVTWSAECETPIAYLAPASGRALRPVGAPPVDSAGLGWASEGRAVVLFPHGPCGSGIGRRGVYLVDRRTLRRTFVYPGANAALWG